MKTIQVRTSARAKAMTAKTLRDNGLTISNAYGRLMSGRGLVARADAGLMNDCMHLHKELRHLVPGDSVRSNKPVYIVYRIEVTAVKERVRNALENLISALEEGSAPKYANITGPDDILDAFYTIRVPFSGMASKEGTDHSRSVRDALDWIREIPTRSNAGHMMSVAQLADTVKGAADVLKTGSITIKGKAIPVTPEVVHTVAGSILGALATLEAQRLG